MYDLNGKVALVTGAAGGIGLACAKELLNNGVKGVALIDINNDSGLNALGEITKEFGAGRAIFVKADVSDKEQFEGAFETTVKTFNQLDIVINNAGILQEFQWEKCIGTNLTGVITGTMLAVEKYFPKYKSGHETVVLNTSSLAGLQPFEILPVYGATKSGVIGFTRCMGGETRYKTTNTRVVAICPGCTETNIINLTDKQIPELYLSMYKTLLTTIGSQTTEELAKHAMNILTSAPTGSVWTLDNGNCEQVNYSE